MSNAPAGGAKDCCLVPDGKVYFRFEFIAYFPFFIARQGINRLHKKRCIEVNVKYKRTDAVTVAPTIKHHGGHYITL